MYTQGGEYINLAQGVNHLLIEYVRNHFIMAMDGSNQLSGEYFIYDIHEKVDDCLLIKMGPAYCYYIDDACVCWPYSNAMLNSIYFRYLVFII